MACMPLFINLALLFINLALSSSSSRLSHSLIIPHTKPVPSSVSQNQACGPQLSIETPSCSVLEDGDGYELRSYPAGQMWAQTVVANASYTEACVTGFYRCFYYISGENSEHEKIEMTGPVLIHPAPQENGYRIAFFVPSRFTSMEDVPTPLDSSVEIVVDEGAARAVLGPFGGFPGETEYAEKWAVLKEALERDDVDYDENTVMYAGYSSPFQIFNRQQEVHVIVTGAQA